MEDSQIVRQLLERGTLVFDGATGTALHAQTEDGEPIEHLCLSAPQCVLKLHQAYLAAGCQAIKTNTFAAHVSMACENEEQQREVILTAWTLARRAAEGYQAAVFADIGPAAIETENAAADYCAMADLFLEAGATCFLFETMPTDKGLAEAAAHIRKRCPQAFILVSFAAGADGFTRAGEQAEKLIAKMSVCKDVDAVGLNCICGAYHMRKLLSGIRVKGKWLSAMPNAGYPHVEEGRTYYDSDPAYYAQQVEACVRQGVRIVGGCCGTTPEHIRQIVRRAGHAAPLVSAPSEKKIQPEKPVCKSKIKQKLDEGKRVILVELDPPRSADLGGFMQGARALAQAGADAITIADCPIGRARMDSSILACKMSRELGIEALPHMTCRDRNVNATKALLLGLSMEQVHNVLVVTGDPIPTEERGSVKSVYQFNSRVLARFITGLRENGEIEPFFVCGALNINANRFDLELERAKEKTECGVEAFLTQPVLSERAAVNLEEARQALKAKLIGGLLPVVSEKNARFLQSEVHGIAVDDAIIRAYEGLDRAQGEELAVRLCRDAAERIAPFVDGYYIMTPFQRTGLVCRVMEAIG